MSRADFLAGLRVLELGDGVAGAAATDLLWSLGADVTTVVDAHSPHRRARPRVGPASDAPSFLAAVLDRGKERIALDGAHAVLERLGDPGAFDLVVADRVGRTRDAITGLDADAYGAAVGMRNPGAWVTISAFGLDGRRADERATELTLAAASGLLAAVRDPDTGRPMKLAGWQTLLAAGLAAALASCHALDLASPGAPSHVDVSALDAAIVLGPVLELDRLLLATGAQAGGARRNGAPAGHFECLDGAVRITALEDHQWRGVVAAMGTPAWTERFADMSARIASADELDERVAAWTRVRNKAAAEATLQAHGVPAVTLSSPGEVLHSPQLRHRDAFEPLALPDGRVGRIVGLPFRIVGRAAADGGAAPAPRRRLRGLRLLEVSHVLAAPLAGALLGALGAEVTKVEDTGRVDMYRRRGPYIDGEPGPERSAYFTLANHSKGNVVFDVGASPARLAELLADTEVVLENLGQRRATAIGVAASSLVHTHPELLAVSSSGFGHDGPHATYRAYAYSMHTLCGLEHLTRNAAGTPAEIDLGWADLVTAYALATTIAAWAVGPGPRSRTGNRGAGLDVSMAELSVARFNDHLAAASLDDEADASFDRDNDLSPYAPHGVYPTVDGWIALVVDGDDEFARLVDVLGDQALAAPALATAPARCERRRELDERVADATRGRETRALLDALQAADVRAVDVVPAPALLADPDLLARGIFTGIEHAVWGRRRLVGIPWRPAGSPALGLGPPPRLDADDGRREPAGGA